MAFRQSFAADGITSALPIIEASRILRSRALYFTVITSVQYRAMNRSGARILKNRDEHGRFSMLAKDSWPPMRDYLWVKIGYNVRPNGIDCDYGLYFFESAADLRACILEAEACLVLES